VFRRKWVLALIAVVVVGGVAASFLAGPHDAGVHVTAETVQRRDLEAIVSASGKIEPKKTVNISAQTQGRVTRLAVNEGDRVKAGQFLMQIDAVSAEAAVRRDEAAVAGARTGLEQSRVSLQSARASHENAVATLKRQRDLWQAGLTTREQLERAETEVQIRDSDVKAREQEIKTRETQLKQQEAGLASSQHTLAQVRFEAPFDGIVTRRNIEEGENVVVGTMNNAGTVLLTVADMSVIEAEVEVDETDIPLIRIGQIAKITIDAMEDKTFAGKVTEIGNSPIQAAGANAGGARTATNFKVVVTVEGTIPEVRPGFTCTAEITTATRAKAVAVPIQSLTVRELTYDEKGNLIREPRPPRPRFAFGPPAPPVSASNTTELKPGHKRVETEGVFVVRDGKAQFIAVKVGIAGERYFEVASGLQEGDRVITGPFDSVRNLFDGDAVDTNPAPQGGFGFRFGS
jgi:HlyD family secretion protein